jgi:hypothetical protein
VSLFLGICMNVVISLILAYSLTESIPQSALSDASSRASLTASLDLSRLQEIEKLLECDAEKWDECLRRASQSANTRKVYAQQTATHRSEALQRAIDGPTEYSDIGHRAVRFALVAHAPNLYHL